MNYLAAPLCNDRLDSNSAQIHTVSGSKVSYSGNPSKMENPLLCSTCEKEQHDLDFVQTSCVNADFLSTRFCFFLTVTKSQ